ncbi:MAG TPA: hypothetical protein VN085_04465, partial [Vicinamibacterales bacterium]|jgi:hypothetical protein|nr:hypothetical protein [Vicinamibacterales bacterium]
MKLPTDKSALRLPVNTLLFRSEGLRVALVRDNRVHLQPVTMGRDFGSSVEVVSGISSDDRVVVNPPDSLEEGQLVRVVTEDAKGAQE